MSSFVKFNSFITAAAAGTHANILNSATGTIKVYLTATAPSATGDSVKTDLAEISNGNGYSTGGTDITNTATTSAGTITVGGATGVSWTATGGAIGPARYAVAYHDTGTGPLIGYWDRGSSVTATAGDTIQFAFATTNWLTLS